MLIPLPGFLKQLADAFPSSCEADLHLDNISVMGLFALECARICTHAPHTHTHKQARRRTDSPTPTHYNRLSWRSVSALYMGKNVPWGL